MKKNRDQLLAVVGVKTATLLVALFSFVLVLEVPAITLMGSNGRAAELVGIKDATPKGLTAQTVADGPLIGIPWSKLDLQALERDHKLLFAAYERAIAGETVPVDIGSYAKTTTKSADGKKKQPKYIGWADTNIGGKTFAIQMPLGEPRGILLLAVGDFGWSVKHLMGRARGEGPWGEFQTKYNLAILSYDYDTGKSDPVEMDSFAFAEKGSGKQVLQAIAAFASQLNQPELVDLPIAVCGTDRQGAAFAYHFALWKPEIVMGGVFTKGGFYNAEPGPEAAKLPLVFIWGEYENNHQLWQNENSAKHVLEKYAPMKPNWTGAMEFRGDGVPGPYSDYFTRLSLKAILDARLPERKPKPEPKPESEGEETEGEETEVEETEEEEPEEEPIMLPYERSQGLVGNLETGEVIKLTDPEVELGENETFIITPDLVEPWKKLLNGELEPPVLAR